MPTFDSDTAISHHGSVPPRPPLLEEVRRRLRLKHYSFRTEQVYPYRILRHIRDNDLRHPRESGGVEVERFLSGLAMRDRVAPSTQNQALVTCSVHWIDERRAQRAV